MYVSMSDCGPKSDKTSVTVNTLSDGRSYTTIGLGENATLYFDAYDEAHVAILNDFSNKLIVAAREIDRRWRERDHGEALKSESLRRDGDTGGQGDTGVPAPARAEDADDLVGRDVGKTDLDV